MTFTDQRKRPSPAGMREPPSGRHHASESQYLTGMSMLASSDAAQRLGQAVDLIGSAAAAGHAEAVARRAVFECAGVGCPVDWGRALDSLVSAAELGSRAAARQLILLAEDRFELNATIDESPGAWRETRSRISIDERLRVPTAHGRILSIDPFVRAISAMATASECQWLIASAAPCLERATLHDKGVGTARTNQYAVLNLVRTDVVAEMIRARIANEIGAPLPCLEVSQVLRYQVGEEFLLHCDFLDPQRHRDQIARFGQRSATFLIYLNEDYDGGETSFPTLGINHRGQTGDAVVFGNLGRNGLPDPRTQHAGRPPTRGEKWVFSQWVRDRYPA